MMLLQISDSYPVPKNLQYRGEAYVRVSWALM